MKHGANGGVTLAEAFKASGLNQRQFAQKLDTSEGQVYRWLSKGQQPSRLYRPLIARALGRKVDEIDWTAQA